MSATIEQQVAWLVAREQIRDVIAAYARAGDANNDPDQMAMLLTPDAVWEAEGFGRFEGRDAICRELAQIGRDRILWSLHFPVSPMIELSADGRAAEAFWWLWELLTMSADEVADETPVHKWLGATYRADFQCIDDRWQIAHLSLRIEKLVASGEGPNEVAPPPRTENTR